MHRYFILISCFLLFSCGSGPKRIDFENLEDYTIKELNEYSVIEASQFSPDFLRITTNHQ